MMKQEAIIHIRFLTSAEGGRTSPISGEKYGCPIMVDGAGFDCRFVLNETTCFELGGSYEIPVNFLNPDLALKHLQEGTKISLWEGKTIGVGKVIKILDKSYS